MRLRSLIQKKIVSHSSTFQGICFALRVAGRIVCLSLFNQNQVLLFNGKGIRIGITELYDYDIYEAKYENTIHESRTIMHDCRQAKARNIGAAIFNIKVL